MSTAAPVPTTLFFGLAVAAQLEAAAYGRAIALAPKTHVVAALVGP
jgi:hypothetical protein